MICMWIVLIRIMRGRRCDISRRSGLVLERDEGVGLEWVLRSYNLRRVVRRRCQIHRICWSMERFGFWRIIWLMGTWVGEGIVRWSLRNEGVSSFANEFFLFADIG